jgi:transcriptional regulator with XRE-family HTH domain
MNTFGARLKALRESLRLNQTDMGRAMGLSLRAYQSVEKDDASPAVYRLGDLHASGIRVNMHWLITGEGLMENPPPVALIESVKKLYDELAEARRALDIAHRVLGLALKSAGGK